MVATIMKMLVMHLLHQQNQKNVGRLEVSYFKQCMKHYFFVNLKKILDFTDNRFYGHKCRQKSMASDDSFFLFLFLFSLLHDILLLSSS